MVKPWVARYAKRYWCYEMGNLKDDLVSGFLFGLEA